ncbi:UNVERIFIED_CONTAM: Retrovirus-related Pol polyprotein from transposon TNT 1-94 [Sesamum radiatum]|uniref:Retrovirus-related Pol polyprotein from transposon TNT 1-94 n=1 Tax=Sesamum radiatum TaxID=300843 RepID=A0AAW2U7N9_SESRA
MMCAFIAIEKGTGRGSVHNSSPIQVLQRSRKLSKDEMILRLGDDKAVVAEAVGSLSLDIWHARLGHISKDRIMRLVDTKSLEIDDLDHLPTCESCLKGMMTKKPFVGQSVIAKDLLDLVHTDVCGPLSIPARGGFSYFITFIDDHSRYGYVYLMRYKSEAFGRFTEYRLEVENQTSRKIKVLRSDRGGEYLSGEFIDYLKENGILSQWTPPGTPQLNGVAERRNRTLLDMVRSMMSFTELPPSFWGHALETTVKLLNISPSKSVPQTPYEIWYGKPASYKYLRVWGSPAYVTRLVGDKLDSRSSLFRFIGYPKETAGYYFYDPAERKVFISRNAVLSKKGFPSDNQRDEVLIEESSGESPRNSTAPFEPTVHTDGVPILRRSTRESRVPERYGFVGLTSQLDNDPKTYREAMSDIDSDKWLEAMKSEMDSMGSNQARGEGVYSTTGVDFEETYSPVAMAKSIRILDSSIAAWYDYEIRQIDVKTAFLNGFVEEEIFMDQPKGFTTVGEEQKMLGDIKAWLSTQFSMKDMGKASYILGIKICRDRSRRMLGLTQSSYIEKVLKRFRMEHPKRGVLPMRHGIKLSKKQSPKTDKELKRMSDIPYASAVGSIQYAVQCTKPDVAYALSVTSRYQACAGEAIATVASSRTMMMPNPNRILYSSLTVVVAWKSSKQDTTADSTMEAEYIAASEAAKEAVWMKNYIQELGVVPNSAEPVVIFCDNNGDIAQAKEPRFHHRSKHILRRYHLLREMVGRGDCRIDRVSSAESTADPLTKPMSQVAHTQHLDKMGLRSMGDWL